jgi:hypothetical protein
LFELVTVIKSLLPVFTIVTHYYIFGTEQRADAWDSLGSRDAVWIYLCQFGAACASLSHRGLDGKRWENGSSAQMSGRSSAALRFRIKELESSIQTLPV